MLFPSFYVLCLTSIGLCAVSSSRLVRVSSSPAVRVHQQPSCILGPNSPARGSSADSLHPLSVSTYASDCLHALTSLLSSPYTRHVWIWKRFDPGQVPPLGYAPLPYDIAADSCTVELDVLSDVTAEDKFALPTLKPDLERLFERCIKGQKGGLAAGYVLVGPKRMVALTLKPTPGGFDGSQGNRRDNRGSGRGGASSDRGLSGRDLFKEGKAK